MDASTELCTDCGICCSGVLFSHVSLEPHELEWAKKNRLPIVMLDEDEPTFNQPCGLLQERKCTDYEQRPIRCKSFRCNLLRALESGTVSLEEARTTTARTLAVYAKVFPNGREDRDPATFNVEQLLDVGELRALLGRFRHDSPSPSENL